MLDYLNIEVEVYFDNAWFQSGCQEDTLTFQEF